MDMEIKEFRYLAAKPLTRSTVVGIKPTSIRRPINLRPLNTSNSGVTRLKGLARRWSGPQFDEELRHEKFKV